MISAGLAFTGLAANPLVAANATVGSCAVSGYATISAAVAASPAHSIIKICPGVYPEQVVIDKPLTLTGIMAGGSQKPIVQAPAGGVQMNASLLSSGAPIAAQILVRNTTNVNISAITVDGKNNAIGACGMDIAGIYYQNASGAIDHAAVKNQALSTALNYCPSGEGIYIESGYGSGGQADVEVSNSSVHGYQSTGITADGSGTHVEVEDNFISGQGPTAGFAETGILFIAGAAGSITGNTVADNIETGPSSPAYGIWIYASEGVVVRNNSIASCQLPLVTVTDLAFASPRNPNGTSDHTTISGNQITNSNYGDGIDACSSFNTITGNTIVNTVTSGIHLDSLCGGTGNNNIVRGNTINESCAGVLQGGASNSVGSNTTFNVQSAVLAGDSCLSAAAQAAAGNATAIPKLSPSRR